MPVLLGFIGLAVLGLSLAPLPQVAGYPLTTRVRDGLAVLSCVFILAAVLGFAAQDGWTVWDIALVVSGVGALALNVYAFVRRMKRDRDTAV